MSAQAGAIVNSLLKLIVKRRFDDKDFSRRAEYFSQIESGFECLALSRASLEHEMEALAIGEAIQHIEKVLISAEIEINFRREIDAFLTLDQRYTLVQLSVGVAVCILECTVTERGFRWHKVWTIHHSCYLTLFRIKGPKIHFLLRDVVVVVPYTAIWQSIDFHHCRFLHPIIVRSLVENSDSAIQKLFFPPALVLSVCLVLCKPAGPSIFNNGETVVRKVYSYGVCLFIIASIWSRRQLYNFADEPAKVIIAFILDVYELANFD